MKTGLESALPRGHRRRRHHGLLPGGRHDPADLSRPEASRTTDFGDLPLRALGHHQEDLAAGRCRPEELAESIHWEAEQYIPFDIKDVYLDYEVLEARRRRQHGRPAGRGQEGQDRRLHVASSPRPARRRCSWTSTCSPSRTATRSTTASTPGRVVALRQHRRLGHERQHPVRARTRSSGATSPSAATSTPTPSRSELNLSFDQAEALKKGEKRWSGRSSDILPDPAGRSPRTRPGAPEDLRLLHGHELRGEDRPDLPLRGLVPGRRTSTRSSRSGSTFRSRS